MNVSNRDPWDTYFHSIYVYRDPARGATHFHRVIEKRGKKDRESKEAATGWMSTHITQDIAPGAAAYRQFILIERGWAQLSLSIRIKSDEIGIHFYSKEDKLVQISGIYPIISF